MKTPWPSDQVPSRHSWDPVRQTNGLPAAQSDYPHYPNGTYPGDPLVRLHRKLPAVPKNKFAHHQSLPEDYSNPYRRESYVSKISSYFKPLGPVKPSSLSLRQSSALPGSPSYMSLLAAQSNNYQMPIVSESPSVHRTTDSMVAMNGWIGEHHRTLPQPLVGSRDYGQRRTLPQPPVLSNTNHASQNGGNVPKPSSQSHNGGFTSGLSDLFSRTTSRDFDWI